MPLPGGTPGRSAEGASPGVVGVGLGGVPSAWLSCCCGGAVAACAQCASVLWVVRVESELDEFAPAVWVVVGDGADFDVAGYADGVAVEYLASELLVSA